MIGVRVLVMIMAVLVVMESKAETCIASVYSTKDKDQNGTITSSGIPLNDKALTAAHRSLPFHRKVRVTHGGKHTFVRITDRGPYVKGRCIDLSRAAAKEIGCNGLCKVTLEQ